MHKTETEQQTVGWKDRQTLNIQMTKQTDIDLDKRETQLNKYTEYQRSINKTDGKTRKYINTSSTETDAWIDSKTCRQQQRDRQGH